MPLTKEEFESSLWAAIRAPAKSGTKWKRLEGLFAESGVRGSGALNNDPAERSTRIRQIFTARVHAGFEDRGHSQHGVLVLNGGAADHARTRGSDFVHQSIVRDIDVEAGAGGAREAIESFLVVRHDGNGVMTPLVLVVWRDGPVVEAYKLWYRRPRLEVIEREPPAPPADVEDEVPGDEEFGPGRNVIFFGPPGVGKSYLVNTETEDFASVLRTVFHPEYTNGDFAGLYKPVTGKDTAKQIVAHDSDRTIPRPVVYYDFEPGVFARALVAAHNAPGQAVALVIEEINRGDCAAIFGDSFQLLDRNETGRSQYGIRVNAAFGRHLANAGVIDAPDHEVFLPANLWVFATMNTADQSLYPMDAAFKRRWHWRSVSIAEGEAALRNVAIQNPNDPHPVSWLELIHAVNERVLNVVRNEDKRVGPWYLEAVNGVIDAQQVRNKLLFYLWHDVFRAQRGAIFSNTLASFDGVQAAFDAGGVRNVFPDLLPIPPAAPEAQGAAQA